jgi:hypothetical protein
MQGTYLLPFWVLLPVLAGHVLDQAGTTRLQRVLLGLATAAVLVAQLVAWSSHAHRDATRPDGLWPLVGDAGWSPPVPWTVLAPLVLTGLTLVAIGVAGVLRRVEPGVHT